jgi:undecaprenyl-diphosphatase
MLGKVWFVIAVAFMMIGLIFGIVHFGYHEWVDVMGGLSFAGLEIIFFHYVIRILDYYRINYSYLGIALSIAVYITIQFMLPPSVHDYYWLWGGMGGIIGLSLGWAWYNKIDDSKCLHNKTIGLCITALFTVPIFYLPQVINRFKYDGMIKAFMFGIIVSLLVPLIDRRIYFIRKKKLEVKA